jgi:hypothetical protein
MPLKGLGLLVAPVALCAYAVGAAAQTPPDVDALLARVAERIVDYYRHAQRVVCTERSTVQPIAWNYTPQGFARTVESELHVESEAGDGDDLPEATVIRQTRKVNGRPPRERDNKDRAGCTDPNPLSPEPLAFLLPAHRREYQFKAAGSGTERNRAALLVDFASVNRDSRPELVEDERGHDDCFDWKGPVATKGRIWVDATTHDVLRVDRRNGGPIDVRVPWRIERRYGLSTWVVVEREDVTIRYRTIAFSEPDERMLLPESIESLIVVRGGLESTRRTQTFSDYRRFLTAGRVVKDD